MIKKGWFCHKSDIQINYRTRAILKALKKNQLVYDKSDI